MKSFLFLVLWGFILPVSLLAQNQNTGCGFKFKKGYYYLLNSNGKKMKGVEPFTFAEPFSEGLALVEKDLKFGFIDPSGTLVIDYKFNDAGSFSNGLAYAAINGKYGYIDKGGTFVIQPQFHYACSFNGSYARVFKSNTDTTQYGHVNKLVGILNREGRLSGNQYYSSANFDKEKQQYVFSKKDTTYQWVSQNEVKFDSVRADGNPVFFIVDQMPEFRGGQKGLINYIVENLRYPVSAQKAGIEGKVYISFVVDVKGDVVDVKLTENGPPKSVENSRPMPEVNLIGQTPPILAKEAIRVISDMPDWKPGRQRGKNVNVAYTIPLNFVLN